MSILSQSWTSFLNAALT